MFENGEKVNFKITTVIFLLDLRVLEWALLSQVVQFSFPSVNSFNLFRVGNLQEME
jgi:hypothetical protein